MDIAEIVRSVRAELPDVLVAVDFDGTLAPLVPDPEQSRPVSGAIEALAAVAASGARVAVITGRDASTVLRLGGLDRVPGIVVAGVYGIETWHAGDLTTPDTPAGMQPLRARLPELLADNDADPDVWIEDKRLSLVVHGRKAEDPDAALAALRAPVDDLAAELGLEVHPGRDVLELRVPGYDKASALRRLARDQRGGPVSGRRPRRRPRFRGDPSAARVGPRRVERRGAVLRCPRGGRCRRRARRVARRGRGAAHRAGRRGGAARLSAGGLTAGRQRVQLGPEPLRREAAAPQPPASASPGRPGRRPPSAARHSAHRPSAETSNGLTRIASSPSSSAAPVSRESTSAGSRSDSTRASSTTRFMPSRTELMKTTSLRRSTASAPGSPPRSRG